jgi:hypothetical protein
MMIRPLKFRVVLLVSILALGLLMPFPQARAPSTYPGGSVDDLLQTEAGSVFYDTALIPINDPNVDILVFIRFESVAITPGARIQANLTLRVKNDYGAASGLSMTVYGIREGNCGPFIETDLEGNPIGHSWNLTRPYTINSAVVNISGWDSPGTYRIDVSAIVQEIIDIYSWASGNDMGFILVCPSQGNVTRQIASYDYGVVPTTNSPRLDYASISLGLPGDLAAIDPNVGNWIFNETYGGYDIWRHLVYGSAVDYIYTNVTQDLYFHSLNRTPPYYFIQDIEVLGDLFTPGIRRILRTGNTTYVINTDDTNSSGFRELWIFNSSDGGQTFGSGVLLSRMPGHWNYHQRHGHIAIDSVGNLHVYFTGLTADQADYRIFYTNYTGSGWTTPINVTSEQPWGGNTQSRPMCFIDENDIHHVVFSSINTTNYQAIFYMNRTSPDNYSLPLQVSTVDLGNQFDGQIVVTSTGDLYIVWTDYRGGGQRWVKYRFRESGVWGAEGEVSAGVGNIKEQPFIVLDDRDYLHVVYSAFFTASTYRTYYRAYNGVAWVNSTKISTNDAVNFEFPTMGIDPNQTLQVLMVESTGSPDILYYRNMSLTTFTWSTIRQLLNATPIYYPCLPMFSTGALLTDEWYADDPDNGILGPFDDRDDTEDGIDDENPDPEDPNPGDNWPTTGPFTRFRYKLYILILGVGCIFGPIFVFVWHRPGLQTLISGLFIMLIGLGLLMSLGYA